MNTHQEKLWSKEFILITLCNLLLFLNLQMLLPSFPVYTKGAFNASDFTVSLVTSLLLYRPSLHVFCRRSPAKRKSIHHSVHRRRDCCIGNSRLLLVRFDCPSPRHAGTIWHWFRIGKYNTANHGRTCHPAATDG